MLQKNQTQFISACHATVEDTECLCIGKIATLSVADWHFKGKHILIALTCATFTRNLTKSDNSNTSISVNYYAMVLLR